MDEQETEDMKTREHLGAIFKRVQLGTTMAFESIRVECGSWMSAYVYVYEAQPLCAKDVTDFSTEMKAMEHVECEESGTGSVSIMIHATILNSKGNNSDEMDKRAQKLGKGAA